MKNNKLLTVLFVGIAAVLFLSGIATACQAARLESYAGGTEVEGIVYDYEVHRGSDSDSGYHCFLLCRYVDENGRNYVTKFQYNFSNASRDDADNLGKAWLNKPVKLYFNGASCISETEMARYVPYVVVSVVLFVLGALFISVPVIKAVKLCVARGEEDCVI